MYRRFAKHERGTIIVYVASIIFAILFAIAYDIKLEAVLYYIGLVTEVEVIYLIISFIMYAVVDVDQKPRVKTRIVQTLLGIFGIILAISLVNIIIRLFT